MSLFKNSFIYKNLQKFKRRNDPVGRADRGHSTPAHIIKEFDYLIQKIKDAKIYDDPFPHVEINNFLSPEHIKIILNDEQIHFPNTKNTLDLITT